jgi:hypothetical protein
VWAAAYVTLGRKAAEPIGASVRDHHVPRGHHVCAWKDRYRTFLAAKINQPEPSEADEQQNPAAANAAFKSGPVHGCAPTRGVEGASDRALAWIVLSARATEDVVARE